MFDVIEPLLQHPYGIYKPKKAKALILGSFPIAKFTNPVLRSTIKENEIDFFYGGEKNKLWKVMSAVFERPLTTKKQITEFLEEESLALGDVIQSCRSRKNSAADKDLYDIAWSTDVAEFIRQSDLTRIYFTSKWVQQKFLKHVAPDYKGESIVLLSPSGAANIAIASTDGFKNMKALNPQMKVDDYRVEKYRELFGRPAR